MNYPIPLQALIESIEALSLEDQALLFEQLYRRRIEKQRQEQAKKAAETTEALQQIIHQQQANLTIPESFADGSCYSQKQSPI
jgi:hypothetical protein